MPTVNVTVMGGIGNQMFQYAAARALALRTGADLVLDVSWYLDSRDVVMPRAFCLDRLPIAARIDRGIALRPRRVSKLMRGAVRRMAARRVAHLEEAHFHFDARIVSARPPVRLKGYFQSERYFADAASQIRAELTPPPATGPAALLARHIEDAVSVSLHVRRTDYVEDGAARIYRTCGPDYYAAAVAELAERVGPLEVFVFSDDIGWAQVNLDLGQPATFVSDGHIGDLGELWLMSRCRHHIIANSTFSWWGAWLNSRPDKLVIAPRQWFRDETFDTTDLLPETWLLR
jgi:hypothetical protein